MAAMTNHPKKIHSIFILLAAVIFSTLSCGKNIKEAAEQGKTGEPAMLVALRQSDYRQYLAKEIEKRYGVRAAVETVRLQGLRKVKSGSYRAIVILDAKMGWTMFNGQVKRFIRRLSPEERNKVVLFMSVADIRKGISIKGVDGITAASRMHNTGDITGKLFNQIDALLK